MVDLQVLKSRGWVLLRNGGVWTRQALLNLAAGLGVAVPARPNSGVLQALSPTTKESAHPKSLSVLHGYGVFPLHTDTAHWPTPARFIVFHSRNPGEAVRPTLLTPLKDLPIQAEVDELISRALFKVVNGRGSFLTCIKEDLVAGLVRYRYDPGCMRPANRTAHEALHLFSSVIERARTEEIRWKAGDVLIVDNWRTLHGRGQSNDIIDHSRVLERILIQEVTSGGSTT